MQDGELDNGKNRYERAKNFYGTLREYARERRLPFRLRFKVHEGRGHSCFGTSARWAIANLFDTKR